MDENLMRSVFGAAAFLAYLFFMSQMILPWVFAKWIKRAPNQARTSAFMLSFVLAFILGGYLIGLYFFPALFKRPSFF
jgi:hypothetical protein